MLSDAGPGVELVEGAPGLVPRQVGEVAGHAEQFDAQRRLRDNGPIR
jgi:hypothetical protein